MESNTMICGCGRALVPRLDASGKKIGVTHEAIEDEEHHSEYFSSLRAKRSPVIEIGEQKGEMPEEVEKWMDSVEQVVDNAVAFSRLSVEQANEIIALKEEIRRLTEPAASHPAPALIVGEREERKYPIGGYGPGNYWNKCVTCKAQFMGDKRAVQCEPCATKMIEEAGGKDYAHIHMKLPNGAAAAVSPNASPELLNALTKMVDLAKDVPPAPTEQALPEGVDEADYYAISKLNDWHLKQLRECQAELKAANIKIKELQEWHDSHL